jgi:amino acid transporter
MSETKSGVLQRRLNLPLLVLYGTGVTIGAGIYVLIGAVAAHAGQYAPLAFVMAALVMGLTVGSYAELCTRYPVAAGEVAYVKAAFRVRWLSMLTGLMMITAGLVATATVALGATGYIGQFIAIPRPLVVVVIVVALGLVAAWGILESVLLASLFTLIEIGGLVAIVVAAVHADIPFGGALLKLPPIGAPVWAGIALASLLAFFAFIGFENLTTVVEESHQPERNVPLAMAITLIVTTVLYVMVAAIAITAVPLSELAADPAPLSLVYRNVAGVGQTTISLIAIVATLNTIIAQMTMATRVIYGMARLGDLPKALGHVHGRTSTPLRATTVTTAAVLLLALVIPFETLAETTSISALIVFAMVNLALIKLRMWDRVPRHGGVHVPIIVPMIGFASCVVMILSSML